VDSQETGLIFVVDDEPHIALALKTCLEESGYRVRSFFSSQKALDVASVERPAAVVCEADMPVVSGFELGERLKELDPECRVLLLTEGGTTHHEFILLEKPVGLIDLLDALVIKVLDKQKSDS